MNAKTNKSKSPFRRHALHLAILTLLYPAVLPANPTGAQVISGQVSIDQSVAGITTVTNTPNAIINWQDFNIAQNEITRFIQQNGQSAVLNRIIGGNPSEILGSLFSNGQVFLINPNGVIFGAGATIDTQGLIASSLNLSDSDFQKGNFHFVAGSKSGDISNEGIIHAGKDGNIVLIAPNIENKGIIQSDGGKITLAAGQELILTSMDEPDIRFQVQAPQNQALNIGQLLTDGGAINVFAGSIKHSGDLNANSVSVNKQGDIRLIAKDNITLESGSKISANNAGKVVVLSDNETHAHGEISATGGFVETSGKKLDTQGIQVKARDWLLDPYDVLIINPQQNASGTPFSTNFTPSTQSTLLTSDIENALNLGSNVTISTTNVSGTDLGNITVASNIRKNTGADSTFTLKADNAIIIQPDVTIEALDAGTGKLNIVLNAGNGNIQLNAGATLNSNGGNIVLGGGTCTTLGCSAAAKGYGVDENQVEGITLSNAKLNSTSGNIFLKGEGFSGTGVSNATGILINESKIDSGTGSITIQGTGGNGTYDTANDIGGENNSGVVITGTQSYPSFISSTGMISIVASNLNSSTTLDSLIFENAGIRGSQLALNATTSLNNTMLEATTSDISLTGSFSSISGFAVLKTGTIAGNPWVNSLSGANLLYSSASVPVNPTGVYVVYREAYPTPPPPPPVEPVIVHPTPEEIEAARLAAEKLAAEEKAKLEAEKLAAEKAAAAKAEAEKLAAEKAAAAKAEAEKLAAEKAAAEKAKLEAEKLAAEKAVAEKAAAEAAAKAEAEKLAAEKAAAEKAAAEAAAKAEAEKLAAEKAAAEKAAAEKAAAEAAAKAEAEKLAAEKAAAEKAAAEAAAKAEAEKLAAEKAAAEKAAAEAAAKAAAEAAAKAEAEKLAAEKAAAEKAAAEAAAKAEAEKLAAEKAAAEKAAAEAAAKAEAERLAAEAAAKAEAERLAAEAAAKAEAERLAAEAAAKAEAERLAAEAAAKAEAERLAAEVAAKAEAERLLAEAKAKTSNPVVLDTIASIDHKLAPKEAEKIVENIDSTAKQQMGAVILNSGSQSSSSANISQMLPPPPPKSEATKQEGSASDKPDEKKEKNTQIAAVTTSETKTPQPLQQCK